MNRLPNYRLSYAAACVASLMLVVTATAQSPSQAGYRSYPVRNAAAQDLAQRVRTLLQDAPRGDRRPL